MTELLPGRAPARRVVLRPLQASEHRALLAAGDLLAALAAVAVALGLWTLTAGVGFTEALATRGWWFSAAVAWTIGLATARQPAVALSITATLSAIARLAAALLVVYLVVYFYAPRQALPRLLALYFAWEAALLSVAWRLVYVWVFTEAGIARRLLIVGSGPAGLAALEALRQARVRDAVVVGFVDDEAARAGSEVGGVPLVGGFECLPDLALREGVSQLVLAAPGAALPVDRLLRCEENGIAVVPMTAVYEQVLRRVPVAHVEPDWLFTSYAEAVSARDSSRLAKRALDVSGACLGAAALLALAPWIALAVWLDSGRPILYRQQRVGRGGRPFVLTKFRTMVPDAEHAGEPRWSEAGDPRVTRVGRWLRRARLDELPNVLSVLRGDMSLVGPRPERPEFVAALERQVPMYRARLIARPGLTGWAQINYPYADSVVDAVVKLEYDLYYLKYRSSFFDLWILLRTIWTVLSLRGR